jgi:hypothetical protein
MAGNKIEGGNSANLTKRGRGRPKGSPNKVTAAAKEVISEVAARLGGADRLLDWVREAPENEKAYWATIYPKLLPLQVNGPGEGGSHIHEVRNTIVRS